MNFIEFSLGFVLRAACSVFAEQIMLINSSLNQL